MEQDACARKQTVGFAIVGNLPEGSRLGSSVRTARPECRRLIGRHVTGVTEALAGSGTVEPAFPICERSEEHTSELPSLMSRSSAVFCLKQKKTHTIIILPKQ